MKDILKKKEFILSLFVAVIMILIFSSTYAYITWRSSNTAVTFTTTPSFSCSADAGGGISSDGIELIPTTCDDSEHVIKKKIDLSVTTSSTPIYADLWLDIKSITSGITNSNNFKYVLTTNENSCTSNVISEGSLKDKSINDKLTLKENIKFAQTSTKSYYLYIWLDETETSVSTTNQSFSLSLGGECTDKESEKPTAVQTLLAKVNDSNVTTYTDGNVHEMYTFNHEATVQTGALTDYRYIGSGPYNYISFNNEIWRILGVFTDNGVQKIKIVRDILESKLWDSGDEINEWPTSTLNTYLNGSYKSSLSPLAQSQISESKYYLGGLNTSDLSAEGMYKFERGNTVYSGRSLNTSNYFGLMYPSDYFYTYALGVDNTCYNSGYNCDGGKPSASWLHIGSYEWLLSTTSDNAYYAFYVADNGSLYDDIVFHGNGVRQIVYLKSDISFTDGDGTSSNPYIIG